MTKKLLTGLVFCMALTAVFPILFLICGSFMGNMEIRELLMPVLGNMEGFASWKLMPQYPTMMHYVELLLDSPEFFVMFWNSVKLTAAILAGQLLVGTPAAWGFARYQFPGKKNFIYYLYCAYDDAFSGDDAQQLSCSGSDEASGHYGRDYFAGSVFHLSGVSDVPFFSGASGSNYGFCQN